MVGRTTGTLGTVIDAEAFRLAPAPAVLLDAHDRIVSATAGLADLLGTGVHLLIGTRFDDLLRAGMPGALALGSSAGPAAATWREGEPVSILRRDRVAIVVRMQALLVDPAAGSTLVVLHDVSEEHRRLGDLSFRAGHEPSSRLPNRTRITEHVADVLRSQVPVAVVAIELDRLAPLVPLVGDEFVGSLIGVAARRIEQLTPGVDVVAHIGPAQLLVAHPGVEDDEDVMDYCVAVHDAIGDSLDLGASSFRTAAICGATMVHPADDVEAGVREALLALRHAQASRIDLARFHPSMRMSEARQLLLERALQDAIEHDLLDLHLQPVVDVETGEITSFESLARWRDPDFGQVSPIEFIGLAEQLGLMRPLGEWCVRTVLAYVDEAVARGVTLPPIAINLSPTQLLDEAFITFLVDEVDRRHAWSSLTVEVTESLLVSQGAVDALYELAHRGIAIAIDDFGTGFSALSYLTKLPATTVKVDRGFVLGIEEPATGILVAGIIALAHALGMRVIAEGVETDAALRCLRELGCDAVQGYLTGRPGPLHPWLDLLVDRRDDPHTHQHAG